MVSSRRADIKDKNDTSLNQVDKFKYLGVTLSERGGTEAAVRARVTAAWAKWRELSGVINDKKMPRRLKVKMYLTVIRPVLLYGAETWTVGKKEERILESTEMRMLRRIKGVTLRDRLRSVNIRRELGVNDIIEKAREIRLRWYGHLTRMDDINPVKAVMNGEVDGRRPRKRWRDNIMENMKILKITPDDVQDRKRWRKRIQVADPAN